MNTKANENLELDEASPAASTLKPTASKSEMLAHMLRVVGGMKKEDLSAFLAKTLDQVGKEDESGLNTSAKNASSISMKAAPAPKPTKEDVDAMFAGQEDLTEEFKERASTIFEAAVSARLQVEQARLEEEAQELVEQQVTEAIEELNEKVDSYIDYVAQKWAEDNQVVLESNYRAELSESFIARLKDVFAEHYVEVPEDKVDLVAELEEKVAQLEEKFERTLDENIELNNVIRDAHLHVAFEEASDGLADTQVDKFRALAESVSYTDVDEYKEKLEMIKESYFSDSASVNADSSTVINEEASIGSNDAEEPETTVVPSEMKSYWEAISRTIKK